MLAALGCDQGTQSEPAPPPVQRPEQAQTLRSRAPVAADFPAGPSGDVIRRGFELVTHTFETLPDHSPSGLHCSSCHLEAGTKANAMPWLGIVPSYPLYRARSGKADSIEDRINDCFERSLNGKALDAAGSDMAAIVAYMRFISRDVPEGETPGRGLVRIEARSSADRARGELLYKQRCSACHAADAQGQAPGGVYAFPALAGPHSFNIGAGMARLNTSAAFIRANMPLGQAGSLSEQQAYDIADYVIHLERPDFADKAQDWPKGDKPVDARY